jgi:hypothetical protein
MTILRRFWDAAVSLHPRAAERDEGQSMPYCTPDELERLWQDAGLQKPATSALVVEAEYRDFDDLWQSLEHGSGPSTAYASSLPDAHRAELRDELRRRLGLGEGRFRLTARAWSVVGHVA